jgi:hypothetical protein
MSYHNSGRRKRASAKSINYAKLNGNSDEDEDPFWSDEEDANIIQVPVPGAPPANVGGSETALSSTSATPISTEVRKKPRLSLSINKAGIASLTSPKKHKIKLKLKASLLSSSTATGEVPSVPLVGAISPKSEAASLKSKKTKGLLNPHIHELLTRDFDDLSKALRVVYNGKSLSSDSIREHGLSHPLLIQDTPQSLGMKVPTPASSAESSSSSFSVKEISRLVGPDTPINVMDCTGLSQEELHGWNLEKLVQHFEDPNRIAFSQALELVVDQHPEYIKDSNPSKLLSAVLEQQQQIIRGVAASKTTKSAANKQKKKRRHSYEYDTDEESDFDESNFNDDSDLDDDIVPLTTAAWSNTSAPRILNQISLEFSNTPFNNHVQSPTFVRELDWIDNVWPADRKEKLQTPEVVASEAASAIPFSKSYPRVQYYCLTSTAGCYTDFHLDFGGTSVWYHVLSGRKIFLLVPPTKHNLDAYESWLCSAAQARTFFAPTTTNSNTAKSRAQQCYKVVLQEGQTLIIPAGWIHAVYTPRDSLVVGGNFLHSLDVPNQLAVHSIETRTRVPKKFRFPHYIQINFFAAAYLLRHLRSSSSSQTDTNNGGKTVSRQVMTPRELAAIPPLLEALRQWNVMGRGSSGVGDGTQSLIDASFGSVAEVAQAAADSVGCSSARVILDEMEQIYNIEFKQQGKCRITSNPNNVANYYRLPLAPVSWSMFPSKKMNVNSGAIGGPISAHTSSPHSGIGAKAHRQISTSHLKRTTSGEGARGHPSWPNLGSSSSPASSSLGRKRASAALPIGTPAAGGAAAAATETQRRGSTGNLHQSKMFRGVATHSQGGGAPARALLKANAGQNQQRSSSARDRLKKKWKI